MAHTQKPDFILRQNGRVHLNRRGRQFSRLLAGELCASACRVCTALASLCSAVMWRLLVTHFSRFPFASPVRHRVPSHFSWTLQNFSSLIGLFTKSTRVHLASETHTEVNPSRKLSIHSPFWEW